MPSASGRQRFFAVRWPTAKSWQTAKSFFVVCPFFAVCFWVADGKELLCRQLADDKELADGKLADSSSGNGSTRIPWTKPILINNDL